jgi:hypothetical protein
MRTSNLTQINIHISRRHLLFCIIHGAALLKLTLSGTNATCTSEVRTTIMLIELAAGNYKVRIGRLLSQVPGILHDEPLRESHQILQGGGGGKNSASRHHVARRPVGPGAVHIRC